MVLEKIVLGEIIWSHIYIHTKIAYFVLLYLLSNVKNVRRYTMVV